MIPEKECMGVVATGFVSPDGVVAAVKPRCTEDFVQHTIVRFMVQTESARWLGAFSQQVIH